MNKRDFIIYLAGVADSDGSFSMAIRHRNRPNPTYTTLFQLNWKKSPLSEKTILKIQKYYGGAVYYPTPRLTSYGSKTITVKYCLTGIKLENFLKDIYPYIQLKKKQVKLLMKARKTKFSGPNKPKKLLDLHYSIYSQVKKLNTKNSGDRRIYEHT